MKLKVKLLDFWRYNRTLLGVTDPQDPAAAVPVSEEAPLPVRLVGGGVEGGGSDADSAREVTLQQVRDAVQALGALLGNTDNLETLATAQRDLLITLGTYNDQVEGYLAALGSNTDGIEGLLSALGVKDDNVLGKLEALRLLLAGTLSVSAAALPLPAGAATQATLAAVLAALQGTLNVNSGNPDPATGARQTTGNTALASIDTSLKGTLSTRPIAAAPGSTPGNIAAGASQGADVDLGGLSVVRLNVDGWATAADLTFETSADGVTWRPLYASDGSLVQYKVNGTRAINVPVGDLLRVNRVRVRSGVPGAYVAQAAAVGVTFTTAVL